MIVFRIAEHHDLYFIYINIEEYRINRKEHEFESCLRMIECCVDDIGMLVHDQGIILYIWKFKGRTSIT